MTWTPVKIQNTCSPGEFHAKDETKIETKQKLNITEPYKGSKSITHC